MNTAPEPGPGTGEWQPGAGLARSWIGRGSSPTLTALLDRDAKVVAAATRIARQREPGLAIDGLQYAAAAIASVGQAKRPGSPVAGRATVFIFPDLDTGNTTYKAVQRSAQVVVPPFAEVFRHAA